MQHWMSNGVVQIPKFNLQSEDLQSINFLCLITNTGPRHSQINRVPYPGAVPRVHKYLLTRSWRTTIKCL